MLTTGAIKVRGTITNNFATQLQIDPTTMYMEIGRCYYHPKADAEHLHMPVKIGNVRIATITVSLYTSMIEDVRISKRNLNAACPNNGISPNTNMLTIWEGCMMSPTIFRIARGLALGEIVYFDD